MSALSCWSLDLSYIFLSWCPNDPGSYHLRTFAVMLFLPSCSWWLLLLSWFVKVLLHWCSWCLLLLPWFVQVLQSSCIDVNDGCCYFLGSTGAPPDNSLARFFPRIAKKNEKALAPVTAPAEVPEGSKPLQSTGTEGVSHGAESGAVTGLANMMPAISSFTSSTQKPTTPLHTPSRSPDPPLLRPSDLTAPTTSRAFVKPNGEVFSRNGSCSPCHCPLWISNIFIWFEFYVRYLTHSYGCCACRILQSRILTQELMKHQVVRSQSQCRPWKGFPGYPLVASSAALFFEGPTY